MSDEERQKVYEALVEIREEIVALTAIVRGLLGDSRTDQPA